MREKVFRRIIALSGLCAVFSHVERQYHFVYDPKNMTEALKYCREKYTDLATIDNMVDVKIINDMKNLSKMVITKGSYPAWIGMYDDVNSWRWSLANGSFYKDRETEFRKWWEEEPNNHDSGEHCTQMYYGGHWNDEHCVESFAAVCFDGTGPNETFVLTNSMPWTEAQSYCRTHHTDLASVRNEEENQKISELVIEGQKVWIGLFRDSWKWSDGSHSSFRYWKPGQPNNLLPNEACVAADVGQSCQWEDWPCNQKAAFICYSRVPKMSKQVMRVRLVKKDSSLDLNDPVVMEDILKQLKQRLKDKGVTADIKLSWKQQSDGKVFHKEEKKTRKRKDEL